MGSQGQGHGHCEKQPSEGGNEDARTEWPSEGSNEGACAEWPSEGGNEGAHAGSQGHPELELGLEDELEEGADGMVIDMAQVGHRAPEPDSAVLKHAIEVLVKRSTCLTLDLVYHG